MINKIPNNLKNYYIIINCSNSYTPIFKDKKIEFTKNNIFIEVGKNLFDQKLLFKLIDENLKIFRLDVTDSFNQLIEQKIKNKKVFLKKNFIRIKKGDKSYISPGLLGKINDIVVDNPLNPKNLWSY